MVMIKQVIDGKTYNTETARCLATVDLMGYRTDQRGRFTTNTPKKVGTWDSDRSRRFWPTTLMTAQPPSRQRAGQSASAMLIRFSILAIFRFGIVRLKVGRAAGLPHLATAGCSID
jgi:hypothetical protein